MILLTSQKYIQIYSDSKREEFLIINANQKDYVFKRAKFSQDEARLLKTLLNSLPELDEPGEQLPPLDDELQTYVDNLL